MRDKYAQNMKLLFTLRKGVFFGLYMQYYLLFKYKLRCLLFDYSNSCNIWKILTFIDLFEQTGGINDPGRISKNADALSIFDFLLSFGSLCFKNVFRVHFTFHVLHLFLFTLFVW